MGDERPLHGVRFIPGGEPFRGNDLRPVVRHGEREAAIDAHSV
jgi:hypothetical protein